MSKATIQIPKESLRGVLEAIYKFSAVEDELEDFLLTVNPAFIKKMRRLRTAHKSGRTGDWRRLKAKYGL